MKKIILIAVFICTSNFAPKASGQDEEFQKQIEEIMKSREEMLNSLLNGHGDIEKKMIEIMKRFSQQAGTPGFDLDEFEGPVVGEYDWVVTDKQRIFKVKVKQVKGSPLDIKIEKGMIRIKGVVESVESHGKKRVKKNVKFERTFSIPDDVDQTNPEFENKEGEVLIKFKRLESAQLKKTAPPTSLKKNDERVPVGPNSGDVNI